MVQKLCEVCGNIFYDKNTLNRHEKNVLKDHHTKAVDADDTCTAERVVGWVRESGTGVLDHSTTHENRQTKAYKVYSVKNKTKIEQAAKWWKEEQTA